jgi:glycosyltransferase involved in cell wall biosynthesis
MNPDSRSLISVVVIGLNEERLLQDSLESVLNLRTKNCDIEIIYVDSGSIDHSFEIAESIPQVTALQLNNPNPTAAKARNFGASKAKGDFIQFVDGDSILHEDWLQTAYDFLCNHRKVACVFGELTESRPEANIYTKVCKFDWYVPSGEARYCGGNALWRKSSLDAEGGEGFDEALSAGEEPDLCYRIRQNGEKIFFLSIPMANHDLEMNTFSQYWSRAVTNGKAYAAVGLRYRHNKEKLWFKEMIRNFIEPVLWLSFFILVSYFSSITFGFLAIGLVLFLRSFKIASNNRERIPKLKDGLLYGFHLLFMRIPTSWGQLKYLLNKNDLFISRS